MLAETEARGLAWHKFDVGRAVTARKHYWWLRLDSAPKDYFPYGALVPPLTLEGVSAEVVQIVVPGNRLPKGCNELALRKLEEIQETLIRMREDNPYGPSAFDWFELAAVQEALGKPHEAEASFRQAEEIRPEVDWRPKK